MEASTCFASCAAALSTRGSIEIASLSGIRQCQRVSCRGNGVGLASAPRFSNWAKFRPEKRLSRKNISISASASLNDGRVDPVKWAERAPYGDPTARRSDLDGRVALKDIKEGQVMAGEIAAVNLYLGAFVDVGAEYDGLVRVQESDWWALRNELRINQRVIVQVVGVYDPTRYRCPLVLKMLSPDISADLLEDYSNDMPIIIRKGESVNAVAKEVGRVEKASAPRNYDSMGSLADDGDLDMEDKVGAGRAPMQTSAHKRRPRTQAHTGTTARVRAWARHSTIARSAVCLPIAGMRARSHQHLAAHLPHNVVNALSPLPEHRAGYHAGAPAYLRAALARCKINATLARCQVNINIMLARCRVNIMLARCPGNQMLARCRAMEVKQGHLLFQGSSECPVARGLGLPHRRPHGGVSVPSPGDFGSLWEKTGAPWPTRTASAVPEGGLMTSAPCTTPTLAVHNT
eukprot:jgi/Mesvir1/733/Mv17338-RA.2